MTNFVMKCIISPHFGTEYHKFDFFKIDQKFFLTDRIWNNDIHYTKKGLLQRLKKAFYSGYEPLQGLAL